jgi:hypothetical protein
LRKPQQHAIAAIEPKIAAAEPRPVEIESGEVRRFGVDAGVRERTASSAPVEVWVTRPQLRRRALVSIGAGGLLIALGVFIGQARRGTTRLDALPVQQQVVVAPFRVTGASNPLGYLREGLVELLSTRLADDSAARAVDAGAVLGAWRRAGLTAGSVVSRQTVLEMAARLGAKRVVIGNVVERVRAFC